MIAAIVVSYNSAPTLARCLQSLEGLPVTVVDNASKDGSAERVAQEFPAVNLIRSERNLGFGAACNLAVAKSPEKPLAWFFLNPDAWVQAGDPASLAVRMADRPRLGAIGARLVNPDGSPQFSWSPERSLLGECVQKLRNPFESWGWNHGLLPKLLRLLGAGWWTGAALCVRAEAFARVGGFDEDFFLYFEDVDLCRRLRAAGYDLAEQPDLVVAHVRGASSGPPRHYRESHLLYYRKHRPAWERALLERYLARS